jgi:hypothetical protein
MRPAVIVREGNDFSASNLKTTIAGSGRTAVFYLEKAQPQRVDERRDHRAEILSAPVGNYDGFGVGRK